MFSFDQHGIFRIYEKIQTNSQGKAQPAASPVIQMAHISVVMIGEQWGALEHRLLSNLYIQTTTLQQSKSNLHQHVIFSPYKPIHKTYEANKLGKFDQTNSISRLGNPMDDRNKKKGNIIFLAHQTSSGKPYLMSSSFSNLSSPMKMVQSPASGRALKQNTISPSIRENERSRSNIGFPPLSLAPASLPYEFWTMKKQ